MRVLMSLVACLSLLGAGCAVLGRAQKDHRIAATELAKVQKGMAKEDVTRILGAPTEIIFSNKEHDPLREHAYIFEHMTTHYTGVVFLFLNFGNQDDKRDRAIVFFDETGKVDHVGASLMAEKSAYGFPFGG